MLQHRSEWFRLFTASRLVEFDTSVICNVFMHCSGSFLLHDMLLYLPVFTFDGQNMKLNVNMLLICIPHRAPGPAVIRTVCKFSRQFLKLSQISYLFSYYFLRRRRSFTARKRHVCLAKVLCFLQLSDRAYGQVSLARSISSFWHHIGQIIEIQLFARLCSGTTNLRQMVSTN